MFSVIPLLLLALLAKSILAVDPIIVNGSDFVNSVTGKRFQIVGVAYQPGGSSAFGPTSDPLSDPSLCLRDAALMQELGINAIRVYSVNTDLNHDDCASIFNAVGIYMLIDVNSPIVGQSLDRSAPWTTYGFDYVNRTFGVVEAFKGYPNTLLFFAGNEIINDVPTGLVNPPYIRAVTRDLKNYIAKNSPRPIPVGYSAADVRSILVDTYNYLQCTMTPETPTTDPSRSDIFALNSYSWCGAATFKSAGYDILVSYFQNTSLPVFFSEYGCNQVTPRLFTEVEAIYGPQMSPVMSGGLVFEYTQGSNNYGLVVVDTNQSAQLLGDFDTLQRQYSTLNVTNLESSNPLNTTNVPPTCNSSLISGDGFANNFTLPAVPTGVQELIDEGLFNANNGRIVTVSLYKVPQVVQASTGQIIKDLEIKPLPSDESNTPGDDNNPEITATPSATASATATMSGMSATSSPTLKNEAGAVKEVSTGLVGLIGLVAVLSL